MELPLPLRRAVEETLAGASLSELVAAADVLSRRYRAELRDGSAHVPDMRSALAYVATRMPATYAAIRASLAAVASARPDFVPLSALDVGAGPGTALWAARDCWPSLDDVLLIEASPAMRAIGEQLSASAAPARIAWRGADAHRGLAEETPRDLVTLAYVLNELEPGQREPLIDRLWQLSADMLVIVEPGTSAGWQRILAARDRLIALGAHIVAPCPHVAPCPLASPDWCHFAARVARSRVHRLAKGADVPWEDEKFIYLAASRAPGGPFGSRVVAPPRTASGRVTLKLCGPDGTAGKSLISRREGNRYKVARRTGWGDAFER